MVRFGINSPFFYQKLRFIPAASYGVFALYFYNILGIYAEEAVDENTWFLKADVTITNAFNAKYDTVVEAKVTFNTNSQEITSFYVYE